MSRTASLDVVLYRRSTAECVLSALTFVPNDELDSIGGGKLTFVLPAGDPRGLAEAMVAAFSVVLGSSVRADFSTMNVDEDLGGGNHTATISIPAALCVVQSALTEGESMRLNAVVELLRRRSERELERLVRSLRWYGDAIRATDVVKKFSLAWISLESLHPGEPDRATEGIEAAVSDHYRNKDRDGMLRLMTRLYTSRCKIFHDGRERTTETTRELSALLAVLRDLLVVELGFDPSYGGSAHALDKKMRWLM